MDEIKEMKSRLQALFSFGGVEIIRIVLGIIKTKAVAFLIGATGIGLLGLFMNLFSMTNTLFNLGINRSAIKFIAKESKQSSNRDINTSISALYFSSTTLAVLGAIFTYVFSDFLSKITFGDLSQSSNIKLLSLGILINPIYEISLAILRGTYKTKKLLNLTIVSSIISIILSVGIFWLKGIEGVIYVIVLGAFTSSLVAAFLVGLNPFIQIKRWFLNKNISQVKAYLKIGINLTISSIFVLGISYSIKIFLRSSGSIEEVGLYTAVFTIINGYFGAFFTSISNEYYPKLSRKSEDPNYYIPLMNYQSVTLILILTPVLIFFITINEFVIRTLYSIEFLAIGKMIIWAALGIYFKAMFYSLGVIFISRGDSKYILYTEIINNLTLIIVSIIGYKKFGFEGLGLAILISNIIAFIHTYLIVHFRYQFRYNQKIIKIFIVQLFYLGISIYCKLHYAFNTLFILIIGLSILYSWKNLNPFLRRSV